MSEQLTVGFIGVGAISEATVRALATGPHAARIRIVLSPRSAARSAALAAEYGAVSVAADNQAVVDAADVVMIAVLTHQVADVCRTLDFGVGQIVVGLAAGWPPSRLATVVAPATDVCQLVPLPMIALHTGPIVLYPAHAAVTDLLTGCGEVVTPDCEDGIPAFSVASSTMSTFFALQRTATTWLAGQGIPAQAAADYATALFHGLTTESVALAADDGPEAVTSPGVVTDHETPGGLNQSVRETLEQAGMFAALADHYDEIFARIR